MEKPLNVAMIFDDLMIGGWTTMASAIPRLDRNMVNPVIFCLFGKGYYADILEKKGFKIHFLKVNRYNFVFKIVYLAWLLRKNKIDIVHTHLLLSHLIGQSAAFLACIHARIMHVHSVQKCPAGILGSWIKWVVGKAAMSISVSNTVEKSFLEAYPAFKGMSKVVYNGIDVCEFRKRFSGSTLKRRGFGIGDDDFCVVTVANFKSEKGHRYLIEAASILKESIEEIHKPVVEEIYPLEFTALVAEGAAKGRLSPSIQQVMHAKAVNIRFLLIGDGAEKGPVAEEVKKRGLEKQFIFLGSREDVPELLYLADIMVLPSVEEGFGICLLEAFAVGIPVIATDVCGISEIAENGKDALLVQPSSSQELAEGISKLKMDAAFRKTLSQSASAKAMDFDIGNVVQGYTEAYCRI